MDVVTILCLHIYICYFAHFCLFGYVALRKRIKMAYDGVQKILIIAQKEITETPIKDYNR